MTSHWNVACVVLRRHIFLFWCLFDFPPGRCISHFFFVLFFFLFLLFLFFFFTASQQLVANTGNFVPPACLCFPEFFFSWRPVSLGFPCIYSSSNLIRRSAVCQECWTLRGSWEQATEVTKYAQIFIRTSLAVCWCGGKFGSCRRVSPVTPVSPASPPRSICSSSASFYCIFA